MSATRPTNFFYTAHCGADRVRTAGVNFVFPLLEGLHPWSVFGRGAALGASLDRLGVIGYVLVLLPQGELEAIGDMLYVIPAIDRLHYSQKRFRKKHRKGRKGELEAEMASGPNGEITDLVNRWYNGFVEWRMTTLLTRWARDTFDDGTGYAYLSPTVRVKRHNIYLVSKTFNTNTWD